MSVSAPSTYLFKYFQGWLNHFFGQPVPMLDKPFWEEVFQNIQPKPPLVQNEVITSCPVTCFPWEETEPHLPTTFSWVSLLSVCLGEWGGFFPEFYPEWGVHASIERNQQMQVKFPQASPDKRHIMSWVNDTTSPGASWGLWLLQLVIRDFSCSAQNEVELTRR